MKILVISLLILIISCNDSSFQGSGSNQSPVEEVDSVEEVEEQSAVEPVEKVPLSDVECEKQSTTAAKLMSTEIHNQSPEQFLTYQVSIDTCDGRVLSLDGRKILFDLNVFLDIASISYEIIVENQSYPGSANPIEGKDLFGNVGETFAFYETVTVPTEKASNSVVIKIDISNRDMEPIDGGDLLQTYFRIGDAKAVEKSVPFFR